MKTPSTFRISIQPTHPPASNQPTKPSTSHQAHSAAPHLTLQPPQARDYTTREIWWPSRSSLSNRKGEYELLLLMNIKILYYLLSHTIKIRCCSYTSLLLMFYSSYGCGVDVSGHPSNDTQVVFRFTCIVLYNAREFVWYHSGGFQPYHLRITLAFRAFFPKARYTTVVPLK